MKHPPAAVAWLLPRRVVGKQPPPVVAVAAQPETLPKKAREGSTPLWPVTLPKRVGGRQHSLAATAWPALRHPAVAPPVTPPK